MRRGTIFQLPTEDAVAVAEELGARFGIPFWQFTLSASQANLEVIRLARLATGREKVLVFDGKYHGHLDMTLGLLDGEDVQPEYLGVSARDLERTLIVPLNDVEALERALAGREVALVLAEPALTNAGLVLPDPGFHATLRELADRTGTVLAIDETQTHACAFGGLTRVWSLSPDVVVLGKSLGGGVPVAAYGMIPRLAGLIDRPARPYEVVGEVADEPATGGTLFANALSLAACRAALDHMLTEDAYARAIELGAVLADGIEAAIGRARLPWTTYRLLTRTGYAFAATLPRNAAESSASDVPALRHLARVYMANRGIWEFGWWAGPMVSLATSREDVEAYLAVFEELLADLLAD
jgi:glutamate-1-semialdehyde 2,1-aminomutase